MCVVSVFNLGIIDELGYVDNIVIFKLKKIVLFFVLLFVNGECNFQKLLVEWIEDWVDYFVGFDVNGDVIQVIKVVVVICKIMIEVNQIVDFEDNDFSGKCFLMEFVEVKIKDIMLVVFEFKCVLFEGLKECLFKLRFSIIIGDCFVLVLCIIQLEVVQEDMVNEFCDLFVEKFKDSKVEIFIGIFIV